MERMKALHLVQENNGHARAYVDMSLSKRENSRARHTSYVQCLSVLLALFLEMARIVVCFNKIGREVEHE